MGKQLDLWDHPFSWRLLSLSADTCVIVDLPHTWAEAH